MLYTIKYLNSVEWQEYICQCSHINLLQSGEYGEAKSSSDHLDILRILVLGDGKPVALAQGFVKKIPIFGRIVRFNRAPLLYSAALSSAERSQTVIRVVSLILNEAHSKNWLLVKFAPEIYLEDDEHAQLINLGLIRSDVHGYGSGLLKLTIGPENLKQLLKKKWRYYLNKGESEDVDIELQKGGDIDIDLLVEKYLNLQRRNNFKGIPESLIRSLYVQKGKDWDFSALVAKDRFSDDFLGLVVVVMHGDTATYLIGITEDLGKSRFVNYSLLWRAIMLAREKGCRYFDIGGLDHSTPNGIAHFKKGLNSTRYTLVGEYVFFRLSILKFIFSTINRLVK